MIDRIPERRLKLNPSRHESPVPTTVVIGPTTKMLQQNPEMWGPGKLSFECHRLGLVNIWIITILNKLSRVDFELEPSESCLATDLLRGYAEERQGSSRDNTQKSFVVPRFAR